MRIANGPTRARVLSGAMLLSLLASGLAAASTTPAAAATPYLVTGVSLQALPAGVTARFDFGAQGFTVALTPVLAAELRSSGARLEPVPVQVIASKGGVRGSGSSSPSNPMTWGVARIVDGSSSATAVPSGLPSAGSGVTVAVLDTGITATHPDLAHRLVAGDAGCYDFVGMASGCPDGNGHGTFVAGLVAADDSNTAGGIYGVAPAARLLAYKVCDNNGSCYADAVAAAINAAVKNGANIINMSFGGTTGFSVEQSALQAAANAGILNVASVGNTASTSSLCTSINYPAAWTTVVSVAATDKNDSVPYFSCRGYNNGNLARDRGEVDLAMPGVSVTSTTRSGGYGTADGTSNAAAYASGLAASVWSAKGGASGVRAWFDSLSDYDVTASNGGGATVGVDAAAGFGLAYQH